jgi:hypothetical protein
VGPEVLLFTPLLHDYRDGQVVRFPNPRFHSALRHTRVGRVWRVWVGPRFSGRVSFRVSRITPDGIWGRALHDVT